MKESPRVPPKPSRINRIANEEFRAAWVEETLLRLLPSTHPSLLDIGAGERPFMAKAIELGYSYRSHDFDAYDGVGDQIGLQCEGWQTGNHNLTCDILDIPISEGADVILCTEVLEHVPDPVRAFEHMCDLLPSNGSLVVTVPFLSLMHQAPYWFQSGLSTYWFDYWASRCGLTIDELLVTGDYADLLRQELNRALSVFRRVERNLGSRIIQILVRRFAKRSSLHLLDAGGFGTFFVGTKRAM